MRVIVLMNGGAGAVAGAEEAKRTQIGEAFRKAGVEVEIRAVPGAKLTESAKQACDEGADAVVAAGGDGTVSAVAGALAGCPIPFGVLPMGTLNHFAKDLNIPLDIDGAAALIAAGQTRPIDVAEVNGRVFVNNSSVGIYPRMVVVRDHQMQRLGRGKWLSMLIAAGRMLRRVPLIAVRVSTHPADPTPTEARRTPFVFVGNNRYEMHLLELGARPDGLTDGKLSLYMPRGTHRRTLLKLAFLALIGRLDQTKEFVTSDPTELQIESRRRHLRVSLDGEVIHLAPPLHYRIRPGDLRVFLPPADSPA